MASIKLCFLLQFFFFCQLQIWRLKYRLLPERTTLYHFRTFFFHLQILLKLASATPGNRILKMVVKILQWEEGLVGCCKNWSPIKGRIGLHISPFFSPFLFLNSSAFLGVYSPVFGHWKCHGAFLYVPYPFQMELKGTAAGFRPCRVCSTHPLLQPFHSRVKRRIMIHPSTMCFPHLASISQDFTDRNMPVIQQNVCSASLNFLCSV